MAEGIVSAVLDLAHEKGGRVTGFKVVVGELTRFDTGLISDLLAELVKGTELERAEIVVERERTVVKCLGCGSRWGFSEIWGQLSEDASEMVHFIPEVLNSFSKCPSCSKSFLEIEEGRSARLARVSLDV